MKDSSVRETIDATYVNTLVNLVNACRALGVSIKEVRPYMNGWVVTFEGYEHADAICHDGSYGSPCYMASLNYEIPKNDWSKSGAWETMGFPWDYNDVSVHTSEELAYFIKLLDDGQNFWEKEEE